MIIVDAMGDACPLPVVKTKNAIAALNGASEEVKTLVDNQTAVENLTKMAQQRGYAVTSNKLSDTQYEVIITPPCACDLAIAEDIVMTPAQKNTVVVIASDTMGSGNDELGHALMKAFIYALSQQDELPSTILFYNGGVKNTTGDSPSIEDLKGMEEKGVEILSCGTCLNYYGLADDLKVGGVTNMYDIVEKQAKATLIIRP